MKKRNAVLSGYFVKNLGDDLMLKSFLRECRGKYNKIFICSIKKYKKFYSDMGLIVISQDTLLYRTLNKVMSLLHFPWLYYKIAVRKSTDFIMLGGSLFTEPAEQGKSKVKSLEYAIKHSNAAFVIGSNFGPYNSEGFYQQYRSLFSQFNDICFRDKYSYEMFSFLPMVRYAPDVVLAGEWKMDKDNTGAIVVSLIDIESRDKLSKYSNEYENFILKLCTTFIKEGEKITLVPMCEVEGDLKISRKIEKKLNEMYPYSTSIAEYTNVEEILRVFASAKKIIATRFHAMILGLFFEKPTIVISYNEKIDRALLSYKAECLFIKMSDIKEADVSLCSSYSKFSLNEKLKIEAHNQFLGVKN